MLKLAIMLLSTWKYLSSIEIEISAFVLPCWIHRLHFCRLNCCRPTALQKPLVTVFEPEGSHFVPQSVDLMLLGESSPCPRIKQTSHCSYIKASRYTALSCMDLYNACFWIGSKKIWDTQIYVVKTLSCTFLWCSCICLIK